MEKELMTVMTVMTVEQKIKEMRKFLVKRRQNYGNSKIDKMIWLVPDRQQLVFCDGTTLVHMENTEWDSFAPPISYTDLDKKNPYIWDLDESNGYGLDRAKVEKRLARNFGYIDKYLERETIAWFSLPREWFKGILSEHLPGGKITSNQREVWAKFWFNTETYGTKDDIALSDDDDTRLGWNGGQFDRCADVNVSVLWDVLRVARPGSNVMVQIRPILLPFNSHEHATMECWVRVGDRKVVDIMRVLWIINPDRMYNGMRRRREEEERDAEEAEQEAEQEARKDNGEES